MKRIPTITMIACFLGSCNASNAHPRPGPQVASPPKFGKSNIAPNLQAIRFLIELNPYKEIEWSIENRGTSPLPIATTVAIEQRSTAGEWTVTKTSLQILENCNAYPPRTTCSPLDSGSSFHPPAWTGHATEPQCTCTDHRGECKRATPGTYRLVLTTCDGKHRTESQEFELP